MPPLPFALGMTLYRSLPHLKANLNETQTVQIEKIKKFHFFPFISDYAAKIALERRRSGVEELKSLSSNKPPCRGGL